MKNILLPTDFSNNAFNAIEYAVQLFKDESCTFYLLNTSIPGNYNISAVDDGPSTKVIEEAAKRNSENKLLGIEKELDKKFKNSKHSFKIIVSFNLLITEIKAVIEEHKIDLIVMGTKGATGAQEVFLGTNTMDTIKKSNIAVIAVPENYTFIKPQDILFTTDFKFSMENKNLPLLRSICAKNSSTLNVLNVYSGKLLEPLQETTRRNLASYFKNNTYASHEMEYIDITEAVEHFQIKHKIDFLVMINNKHSFLENLLFKPVIQQIVYHTSVPFMVIPSIELINS